MSYTLKLHHPDRYELIQRMIRSHKVLWLDVEMRINDSQPAMVGVHTIRIHDWQCPVGIVR